MNLRNASYESPPATADVMQDGLLQQVLRLASQDTPRGLVIALTAVDRQSDVMLLAEMLAEEMGADNGGSSVCVDSRALTKYAACRGAHVDSPARVGHVERDEPRTYEWHDGQSRLKYALDALRENYQYSLIACPALKSSSDILTLASLVDGILVVIDANRTRQREIELIENTILSVRGSIIGHILDRRRYFIPSRVYELLTRFGL